MGCSEKYSSPGSQSSHATAGSSIFKGAHATLELVLDYVRPEPLDHVGVVVAISQVVVQCREAMLVTRPFHASKLLLIESWLINISPVVCGAICSVAPPAFPTAPRLPPARP